MIRKYVYVILAVAALIIIGGWWERGYVWPGAELLVVPLLGLVAYECWKEDQQKKGAMK